MDGRDGYSNAELVEMFPTVPGERCHQCRSLGTCTWTLDGGPWLLCARCWEERWSRVLSQEGTA